MIVRAQLAVLAVMVAVAVPGSAQQVTVAGALPGNTPHASDTEQFTQLEERIRKDYVAAHPMSLKDLFGPKVYKFLKEDQVPVESRFSAQMTRAVLGQMTVEPDPMKRPSYLQQRAFSMLTLLPFGDVLQKAVAADRKAPEENTSGSDKLAKQNLENFKKIVAVYGEPGAANRFDGASPAQKTQMFLDAFKVYLNEDLAFPNPYTIYVLDSDSDDDEHPERPHFSHSTLNRMAGIGNSDDYAWESYSREHKTEVFHKAFLHFTDLADLTSHQSGEEQKTIVDFAKLLGVSVIKSGNDIVAFVDPYDSHHYTDHDVIMSVFGKDALAQFDSEPDPQEKKATRKAGFIMYFALERVVAGALVR